MSKVIIHILDLASGRSDLETSVLLEFLNADGWQDIAQEKIDFSGQPKVLVSETQLEPGIYRISVNTKAVELCPPCPYIPIVFEVSPVREVYEISLMISASGYTVNVE